MSAQCAHERPTNGDCLFVVQASDVCMHIYFVFLHIFASRATLAMVSDGCTQDWETVSNFPTTNGCTTMDANVQAEVSVTPPKKNRAVHHYRTCVSHCPYRVCSYHRVHMIRGVGEGMLSTRYVPGAVRGCSLVCACVHNPTSQLVCTVYVCVL